MGDLKHDRRHTGYDLEEEYFYFRNREAIERFKARRQLALVKGSPAHRRDYDAPAGRAEWSAPPGEHREKKAA